MCPWAVCTRLRWVLQGFSDENASNDLKDGRVEAPAVHDSYGGGYSAVLHDQRVRLSDADARHVMQEVAARQHAQTEEPLHVPSREVQRSALRPAGGGLGGCGGGLLFLLGGGGSGLGEGSLRTSTRPRSKHDLLSG